MRRIICCALFVTTMIVLSVGTAQSADKLHFIDTSIENGSSLDWELLDDGTVRVDLLYDHERQSPNRAALHWHFRVDAEPGCELSLILNNFHNVYNGRIGLAADDETITFISLDGRDWQPIETDFLAESSQLKFTLHVPASGSVHVARLPPYRISELNRLFDEIREHPQVKITTIGKTVQGRPLEIVRVGREDAPHRVFIRARAHPWESGGNWVVEGLIRHLIATADDKDKAYLDHFCVYVMPMANKDGVAMGRSRFNMLGKDLNRDWDAPANPQLCPENAALEEWLTTMLDTGKRPHLALEMHNDSSGKLHLSDTKDADNSDYLVRMLRLEEILRAKSWFREGTTGAFHNSPATLGQGWWSRFGIDAAVHELNANWIEGLQERPSAENWMLYGRQLCDVFDAYFEE
ncbi:M14 family zinc carboxypeptidase [Rubripirellula reticaptiva]|uniref:Zinc carboxypeptidase n=1 Tax=Rubripirellula reticaptiva TaxID=2528013 RepID=A0A5C6FCK8_9BACT|nr:M14 family zinc carboxypeptidase [Rubripirellula reticaptiva]TWU58360.1 Zinc carboxypeptidase [Rubripirellula reticaptiva]